MLAGDGTKLRAQNSKKNNFNEKKIERHVAYIDDKLNEYSSILASEDNDLTDEKKKEINDKINKHQQHKTKYEDFKKQLDDTGEVQISTSDPDSRQMITCNNITEVAYNVQRLWMLNTTFQLTSTSPIKMIPRLWERLFVEQKLFLANRIL